jgi:dihydrofolate reductase
MPSFEDQLGQTAIDGKETYKEFSKTLKIDEYNGKNCVKSFATLEQLDDYVKTKNYSELWVIGGAEIYELFLNNYKKQ